MIRVQREDFDVGAEIERLTSGKHGIGGVASFVGLVRSAAGGEAVGALTLEHYPGMTEKLLAEIETQAQRRQVAPTGTMRTPASPHNQAALALGVRVLSAASPSRWRRLRRPRPSA